MEIPQARQLIQDLAAMGCQEVRFTGGEPLLYNGFKELVELAKGLGLRTSLISNGRLLANWQEMWTDRTDECAIFLSVDSPRAIIHDTVRGCECLGAIDSFLKQSRGTCRTIVNTVMSKLGGTDVTRIPEWMATRGITVLNPIPMKHATMALPEAELNELLISLLNKAVTAGVDIFVEGPSDSFLTAREARQLMVGGTLPFGCAVGRSTLFVDVDGTCFPCNSSSRRFPHLRLGNAFEMGIKNLWTSPHAKSIRSHLVRYIPQDCRGVCDFSNVLRNHLVFHQRL